MASIADIVNNILNLSEEQFFAADRAVLAPREALLLDTDFTGIAINAPRTISVARRSTLPLVLALGSNGPREWDVPLRRNALLVGVNLDDGSVRLTAALATKKERETRGGREWQPRGPAPATLGAELARINAIDVRDQLGIKWAPATWSLAVLDFDWRSNIVTVALEGDRPQAVRTPPNVQPEPHPECGGPERVLPCYLPMPGMPNAPPLGAAFKLDLSADAQRLEVLGAFSVRLRDRHVAGRGIVHQFESGRRESVAAVVPMTLALVGLDLHDALQFDWAVPVYGAAKEAGVTVTGRFALDALAGYDPIAPGRYAAYLIMDDTIAGPEILEVGAR